MDTQGYVMFKGECSPTVTGIDLQLDDQAWHEVPTVAVTPAAAETAPAGVTWNADCANGQYQFWLFQSTVSTWFGSTDNTSKLRLRGTVLGVPAGGLEFTNTHSGSGGSTLPPDRVVIQSWSSPLEAVGLSGCASFDAILLDAQGNQTSSASVVPVSVEKIIGSSSLQAAFVTTDPNACWANFDSSTKSFTYTLNAVTSVGVLASSVMIPAQSGRIRFYYKPSWENDGSSVSAVSAKLRVSSSALTGSPGEFAFTLYPDATTFLSLNINSGMVKGACYPFAVSLKTFGGADVSAPYPLTLTFDVPADVGIYDDAGCSALTTGAFITNGSKVSKIYWIKSTRADSQVPVRVTGAYSGSSAVNPVPGSQATFWDSAAHAGSATKVVVGGDRELSGQVVGAYMIQLMTDHFVAVPAASDTVVTLTALDEVQLAKGYFCETSPPCSSWNSVSSVTVPAGAVAKVFYFTPWAGGALSITASSASLASTPQAVFVSNMIAQLIFTAPVLSNSWTPSPLVAPKALSAVSDGACVKLTVQARAYDQGRYMVDYVVPANFPLVATVPSGDGLFLDSGCHTAASSIEIAQGASSADFYYQPSNVNHALSTKSLSMASGSTYVKPFAALLDIDVISAP